MTAQGLWTFSTYRDNATTLKGYTAENMGRHYLLVCALLLLASWTVLGQLWSVSSLLISLKFIDTTLFDILDV